MTEENIENFKKTTHVREVEIVNTNQSQSKSQKSSSYNKVTSSKVSESDNLICDNCINMDMMNNKLNQLERQREEDKEFALQMQNQLMKELEDERNRNQMKKDLYKEAIKN